MPVSPELEIIDQLEGGPLPLKVAIGFFPDREQALRVLLIYVGNGIVRILHSSEPNSALKEWEVLALTRRPSDEAHLEDDSLMVELLPEGARRWNAGEWGEI